MKINIRDVLEQKTDVGEESVDVEKVLEKSDVESTSAEAATDALANEQSTTTGNTAEVDVDDSTDEQPVAANNSVESDVDVSSDEPVSTKTDVDDSANKQSTATGNSAEADVDELTEEQPVATGNTADSAVDPADTSRLSFAEGFRLWLHKYGSLAVIAAAMIVLLAVMLAYTTMIPRTVNAVIDGEKTEIVTKEHTIEGFITSEGIKYCEEDFISIPLTGFVYDGMSFEFKHATDFKVTVDGRTIRFKSLAETVDEALEEKGINVRDRDIVTPERGALLEENMEIVVQRVETEKITAREKVPFDTVKKKDKSMAEGDTKVITEGKNGKDKVIYEVTYIDGEEASRKELSRENIKDAVDEVVAVGTQVEYNGKLYSRKLVVKAYSYTGGGTTAMGTKARVGEIAVDPGVIPLGTNVYIPGVGARRAEDTGGNIKGNTIDIYMNTKSECINWGVRYITIYIE